jgi:putative PIN family toxin of toxin-antitoxin system
MRIVLDTNTVISGLLWFGNPRQILDLAEEGTVTICTSSNLLNELEKVLARPKFTERLATVGTSVEEVLDRFIELAEVVEKVMVVTADPDDDAVISCALAAGADCIVSGDAHLLDLKSYGDVEILSAVQFLGGKSGLE